MRVLFSLRNLGRRLAIKFQRFVEMSELNGFGCVSNSCGLGLLKSSSCFTGLRPIRDVSVDSTNQSIQAGLFLVQPPRPPLLP